MAASLRADIESMQTYMDSSRMSLNAQQHGTLMTQQFEIFKSRIASIRMQARDAALLDTLIRAGPWSVAQREALCGEIANTVSSGLDGTTGRVKNQNMRYWGAYSTQAELDLDADVNYPVDDKLKRVASRMRKIKLQNPSEAAYKNIMTTWMAGCKFTEEPSSDDIFQWLLRLKQLVKQGRAFDESSGSQGSEHIVDYPKVPWQIWFDDAAPVCKMPTVAETQKWNGMIAMRNTSRHVRPAPTPAAHDMNTVMMRL